MSEFGAAAPTQPQPPAPPPPPQAQPPQQPAEPPPAPAGPMAYTPGGQVQLPAGADANEHRSFQIRRRSTDGKPRTFDLNGQVFIWFPDRLPTLVTMDLNLIAIHNDSQPMWDMFRAVMPQDYERFRRMVRSPELMFEAEDLRGILEMMIQTGGERPT